MCGEPQYSAPLRSDPRGRHLIQFNLAKIVESAKLRTLAQPTTWRAAHLGTADNLARCALGHSRQLGALRTLAQPTTWREASSRDMAGLQATCTALCNRAEVRSVHQLVENSDFSFALDNEVREQGKAHARTEVRAYASKQQQARIPNAKRIHTLI